MRGLGAQNVQDQRMLLAGHGARAVEGILWEVAPAEATEDGHQLPSWHRGREQDVQSNPR